MTQLKAKALPLPSRSLLRSLLQKCVRRGYGELAKHVAYTLGSYGDSLWLRSRTGVIIFEECWQAAHMLQSEPTIVLLEKVASFVKNKDAAGLGSLGYAVSTGDMSPIEKHPEPLPIKIIAAGLERPESFFKWARERCKNEIQESVVNNAAALYPKATWHWDKAFIIAGAYLSTHPGTPDTSISKTIYTDPFPFWVAVDKHTPQGKRALRNAAIKLNIKEHHLQWMSFYFESSTTNQIQASPWWETEVSWRFARLGLEISEAKKIWADISQQIAASVKNESEEIQNILFSTEKPKLL